MIADGHINLSAGVCVSLYDMYMYLPERSLLKNFTDPDKLCVKQLSHLMLLQFNLKMMEKCQQTIVLSLEMSIIP